MNNKFIRDKFDGLTSEIHKWDLLKISTILKQEYKQGNVEIAVSYLNAAKKLYMDLKKENHPQEGVSTLRTNQLTIPFLYLCRHTVELSIKVVMDNNEIKYGNIHNLDELFSKLSIKEEIKKDYIVLMKVLDFIDDKGMWLRYDKDLKYKKEYIEKPLYINATEIIKTTEEFVKFLLNEISNH